MLHLRNPTRLPVTWRLGGIDNIGDEFSFSQEQGVIQSKSEFQLRVHFRSPKPVVHPKKTIKIEVGHLCLCRCLVYHFTFRHLA